MWVRVSTYTNIDGSKYVNVSGIMPSLLFVNDPV